jgi:hypothetical protein
MTATRSRLLVLTNTSALLHGGSSAYSSFTLKCTLPPPGHQLRRRHNARSTLIILWNCLSIILLCTWTVVRISFSKRNSRMSRRHLQQYQKSLSTIPCAAPSPSWMHCTNTLITPTTPGTPNNSKAPHTNCTYQRRSMCRG